MLNEQTERQRNVLINNCLGQIAIVTSQIVSQGIVAVYCQGLRDINETQLQHAFEKALANLGNKLPTIKELRQYAEDSFTDKQEKDRLITAARVKKTLDFYRAQASPEPTMEHLTPEELEEGRKRYDVFINAFNQWVEKSEVNDWLEAGKEKQHEFIAKCHADPKWVEIAERLGGFPGLKPKAIPTTVPTNSADRTKWAEEKAKTQGWKE